MNTMNMKIIKSGEKKRIVRELEEIFGISELPYMLIETGKQKVRGFTGNMLKEEFLELCELVNVEIIGAYLIKREGYMRLSLDATQILKDDITKNIIEINSEEYEDWIRGKNLETEKSDGIYVIKFGEDFVGCGISKNGKIINFIPKERRVRN